MSGILSGILEPIPEYDPARDPLASAGPEELTSHPVHVAVCGVRYGTLKGDVWQLRKEVRGLRVFFIQGLLLAAIVAVFGFKVLNYIAVN